MMGSKEPKTHEVRTVFAESGKSESLSEVIGFVVSRTYGTKESDAFSDQGLKRESLEGYVPDIPSNLASVSDNPGGGVIFSNRNRAVKRETNVFHEKMHPS